MKKKRCIVIVVIGLVSLAAYAEIGEGLLRGLAELAVLTPEGKSYSSGCLVSPFIYSLDPKVIVDLNDVYPIRDYNESKELTALCAYVEWVQQTGNRSVIIYYTNYGRDSFDILKGITSINVDGTVFKPGFPVLVEVHMRTLDYTDCSCGSEAFFVYAIPMGNDFLEAIQSGDTFVVGIQRSLGSIDFFRAHRDSTLDSYIEFLNNQI